jgi:hypothetical protein
MVINILLLLIRGILAFDCFAERFPINIGCDSGETVINSMVIESSTSIYFGGYSKCTDYINNSTLSSQATLVGKSDST